MIMKALNCRFDRFLLYVYVPYLVRGFLGNATLHPPDTRNLGAHNVKILVDQQQ